MPPVNEILNRLLGRLEIFHQYHVRDPFQPLDLPIHHRHRNLISHDTVQLLHFSGGSNDKKTIHFLSEKEPYGFLLPLRIFSCVSDQDSISMASEDLLHTGDDGCHEDIVQLGNDHAHSPGPVGL